MQGAVLEVCQGEARSAANDQLLGNVITVARGRSGGWWAPKHDRRAGHTALMKERGCDIVRTTRREHHTRESPAGPDLQIQDHGCPLETHQRSAKANRRESHLQPPGYSRQIVDRGGTEHLVPSTPDRKVNLAVNLLARNHCRPKLHRRLGDSGQDRPYGTSKQGYFGHGEREASATLLPDKYPEGVSVVEKLGMRRSRPWPGG